MIESLAELKKIENVLMSIKSGYIIRKDCGLCWNAANNSENIAKFTIYEWLIKSFNSFGMDNGYPCEDGDSEKYKLQENKYDVVNNPYAVIRMELLDKLIARVQSQIKEY